MAYAQHFSTKQTPQSESAHKAQIKNSAGGYSFQADKWQRLSRWLILGSEGGSYYAGERELTRDNCRSLIECLDEDGSRAVKEIVAVSVEGRAPKNDSAIFALAIAAGHSDPATRKAALDNLSNVCRIGTHLFQFVDAVGNFRGWGRSLRKAVGEWYAVKSEEKLCYQVAKYRQRGGWSHRDVLRKAHVPNMHQGIARYVIGADAGDRSIEGAKGSEPRRFGSVQIPEYLQAFDELQKADWKRTIALIQKHGFTHEMILTEHKNRPEVWEALLDRMPMTAMIRNLGKMTDVGIIKPMGSHSRTIAERITNQDALKKARIHPLAALLALRVYQQGRGVKGSLSWSPDRQIVDALDEAFYLSFGNVEASGKRTLLALDVSASMTWNPIAGMAPIAPREASAAMAMVTARAEKNWHCVGFTGNGTYQGGTLTSLNISPRQRLDDIVSRINNCTPGPTDCAAPMLHAASNNLDVDTFVIYTDNETWHGDTHPHQSLEAYRAKSGINARLVVVGMVASNFTIADPKDPGMLDVVGFDTATPNLLAQFSKGL